MAVGIDPVARALASRKVTKADIAAAGGDAEARLRASIRPPLVAVYGDSRSGGGKAYASRTSNLLAPWIEALTGGRVRVPGTLALGTGGATTVQLSSDAFLKPAIEQAVANNAGAVILIAGTNDRSGDTITAAQTCDNLLKMENAFLAVGIPVVWLAEYPRGSSNWAGTNNPPTQPAFAGTRLLDHLAVHRWLMTRRRTGVTVLDTFSLLADRSSSAASTAAWMQDAYSVDGVHLTTLGCFVVARALVPILLNILPGGSAPLPVFQSDIWSDRTQSGAHNANPTLNGTGGVLNGGAAVTGDLAFAWKTSSTFPAGLNVAFSKVADDVQQIRLTGQVTDDVSYEVMQRDGAFGASGIIAGRSVQVICDCTVVGQQTGLYGVNPFVQELAVGGARWSACQPAAPRSGSTTPKPLVWPSDFSGVFMSDPLLLTATTSSLRTGLDLRLLRDTPIDVTLQVRSLASIPAGV